MRRAAALIVVVGVALGVTWSIASAQDADTTVVLCTRPGSDVRAPDSQGRCPSGYARTEVVEGPVATAAIDTHVFASLPASGSNATEAVGLPGGEGRYRLTCLVNPGGVAYLRLELLDLPQADGQTALVAPQGGGAFPVVVGSEQWPPIVAVDEGPWTVSVPVGDGSVLTFDGIWQDSVCGGAHVRVTRA